MARKMLFAWRQRAIRYQLKSLSCQFKASTQSINLKEKNMMRVLHIFACVFLYLASIPSLRAAPVIYEDTNLRDTLNFGCKTKTIRDDFRQCYRDASQENYELYSYAELSKSPIPYVKAGARSEGEYALYTATAGASYTYNVNIFSSPEIEVLIRFSGIYSMEGFALSNWNPNRTHVSMSLSSLSSGDFANVNAWCSDRCIEDVRYGGAGELFSEAFLSGKNHLGSFFSGSLTVVTGTDGWGYFSVSMGAEALRRQEFGGIDNYNGETTAYMDPYFYVDPDWLANNSGAQLFFPEHMGNSPVYSPQSVPEPASSVLMGFALAGVFWRRIRQVQSRSGKNFANVREH